MSNVGTRFEPGWRATSNVNPNPNGKLSSARAGKVSPVAPMIVIAISEMAARRDNTVTEIIKTLGARADGSSGGRLLPNVCEIDQIMAAQISSDKNIPATWRMIATRGDVSPSRAPNAIATPSP
jgi:hypothetical protein